MDSEKIKALEVSEAGPSLIYRLMGRRRLSGGRAMRHNGWEARPRLLASAVRKLFGRARAFMAAPEAALGWEVL